MGLSENAVRLLPKVHMLRFSLFSHFFVFAIWDIWGYPVGNKPIFGRIFEPLRGLAIHCSQSKGSGSVISFTTGDPSETSQGWEMPCTKWSVFRGKIMENHLLYLYIII